MNASGARARSRGGAVLLLAALLFLPGLGSHDLWDPDEPRYALISREMYRGGDLLVPRENGEIYTQKPPMTFWLQTALAAIAGGHGPWVARLPSALAATGSVWLTWLLGCRLFGPVQGVLAALVLATAHLVQWNGHAGTMDSLLSFWILLAAVLHVRAIEGGEGARHRLLAGQICLGLATLTKGPAAALALLLALAASRWWIGGRSAVKEIRPLRGLLIAAAVAALWLLPAAWREGAGYLEAIAYRQTVVRYLEPWHHHHPPHYYLGTLPLDFLPWTPVFLMALPLAWREGIRKRDARWLFLLAWLLATLAFFSASPGKRNVYLLPCFPAIALLAGAGLTEWLQQGRDRLVRGAAISCAALFAAAGWLVLRMTAEGYPSVVSEARGFLAVTGVAAVATLYCAACRRASVALVAAMCTAAASWVCFYTWVLPACDPVRSIRPFAETIAARLAPGEELAIFHRYEPDLGYYLDRPMRFLPRVEELAAAVRERPRGLACVLPLSLTGQALEGARLVLEDRVDGIAGAASKLVFGRLVAR